jgi:pimeloyl-ACP methyl ester carboxylesterase
MAVRSRLAQVALRRVVDIPPSSDLPPGYEVELPGRGTAFVSEIPGPPGAPTLILLHGLACTAYLNWFPVLPELGQRYRVILVDQRGHGRGMPVGRFFRLRDLADDVVAVADKLGIQSFIPVGYSMGGPVAQLIWRYHPHRVDGLVLCATARNFRGTPYERLFFMLMPAVVALLALRRPGTASDLIARTISELPADRDISSLDVPNWAWAEFRRTSPWTMVQAINAIGQFSSHRWIRNVDVPTAVVVTTRDRFIPVSRQIKLAQAIPAATMHPFPGSHAACVFGADRFVPALIEACDSVTARLEEPAA